MSDALRKRLRGGDLRSIGDADQVMAEIKDQHDFDALFQCLYDDERLVVMRAADAVEKVSSMHPEYLIPHQKKVMKLGASDINIELKWHVALLLSRLDLGEEERKTVFEILKGWASNPEESKIVRVNAIQALYELSKQDALLSTAFMELVECVKEENIASINARIRTLALDE